MKTTLFQVAFPKYPIIHIVILKESSPIIYIAKEVKAPRNEETAIPTIRRVATFTLFPFLAILKIIRVLIKHVIKAIIPYIKSGIPNTKAITAPKVALAAIPIIYGSASGF